jgi:hypothetical protein
VLIAELGLTPETREAWYRAGIRDTDQLRRTAVELLALPGITGSILYETVRRLNEYHLGLPASPHAPRILAPTTDDLEMLRLRVVEGASLLEIGDTFELSRERVRQRLQGRFGLSGEPSAVHDRRGTRGAVGGQLERMIACRLRRSSGVCQRREC